MDRLFLDANVVFSAAYRDAAGVQRLWALEQVTLLTSDYAIDEVRRNLHDREQQDRLDHLLQRVQTVTTVSLDLAAIDRVRLRKKDWPIIGAAVAADATHLITGDRRDFGRFFGTRLFGVLVLPPSLYLAGRAQGGA